MDSNKLPQIDKSAKNSEESIRNIKNYLNMSTGFICRADNPDYGCDLEIELLNTTGATNCKFSVQVKAIEKLERIKKGTFISYPLEIKTLNYISRPPAYGIIIIYDVENRRSYYEFIDEIIRNIEEKKSDTSWRKQDTIKIHIPIKNILDNDSALNIHSVMTHRFSQFEILHQSLGKKYSLPVINTSDEFHYDFNNLDHLKKLIKEYGMQFINQYDLGFIYDVLIKIPHSDLYADKDLLIIAIITYSEVGYSSDSQVLVSKLLKKFILQNTERVTIDFVQLKNNLNLGRITDKEYLLAIKRLILKCKGDSNRIILSINIIYFELTLRGKSDNLTEEILAQIMQIFISLDEMKISNIKKCLLKLWNADNLSIYITASMAQDMEIISERGGIDSVPYEERRVRLQKHFDLNNRLLKILREMEVYSNEINNMLLKANVAATHIRYILTREIELLSYNVKPSINEKGEKNFLKGVLKTAADACEEFLKHKHYLQAYNLLVYLIELIYLSRSKYGTKDSFDIIALSDKKKEWEIEFDLPATKPIVPILMKEVKEYEDLQNGLFGLRDCDDGELERLAIKEMESGKYPNARQEYILGELRGYREFHQRCPSSMLELHVELRDNNLKYSIPTKFIIHSKATGIDSLPNESINILITAWGY